MRKSDEERAWRDSLKVGDWVCIEEVGIDGDTRCEYPQRVTKATRRMIWNSAFTGPRSPPGFLRSTGRLPERTKHPDTGQESRWNQKIRIRRPTREEIKRGQEVFAQREHLARVDYLARLAYCCGGCCGEIEAGEWEKLDSRIVKRIYDIVRKARGEA